MERFLGGERLKGSSTKRIKRSTLNFPHIFLKDCYIKGAQNFSKNELLIFIAVTRQRLKPYLHKNNQKQIIQKYLKKRKSPVRFCLLI